MRRKLAVFVLVFTLIGLSAPMPAVQAAPMVRVRQGKSINWSGYAVAASNVTWVSGSWTVPSVNCAIYGYSSIWVGIVGDSTVEHLGTEQECADRRARYYAWYEMYPKRANLINIAISPGDVISASVTFSGKNSFTLAMTNTTTGKSFSITQKANAKRLSAEWIVEAPWSGDVLPLANFGTASLYAAHAKIAGKTGSISTWSYEPLTMVTSDGSITKAAPSPLSSCGSAFSVTWHHS